MKNQPLLGYFDLQGHRGARGLKPENTFPAFEACIQNQMTTIELDTNLTKDDKLIICHDTHINTQLCRDVNGQKLPPTPINQLTVAEIKKIDCGAIKNPKFPHQTPFKGLTMPTLEAFFERIKLWENENPEIKKINFNIEIKYKGVPGEQLRSKAVETMIQTIKHAEMVARATIQCFDLETLKTVKDLNFKLKTSALFDCTNVQKLFLKVGLKKYRQDILNQAIAYGTDILSPNFAYVNPWFVNECHRNLKQVLPWTVNDRKLMHYLFDCGVDGMISDYPDQLFQAFEAWQKKETVK